MVKSADDYIKKAKNNLKTGIFKWNKDYVSAAMNYDEAAKICMANRDYEKAIWVYQQLIPVNEKLNDNFQISKCYENIINCRFLLKKENFDIEKAFQLFDLCSDYFALENVMHNFYILLEKIGNSFSSLNNIQLMILKSSLKLKRV